MSSRNTEPTLADIRAACASVEDPEFGVSVDDLGLIYDVTLNGSAVAVAMTLTTPSCPAAMSSSTACGPRWSGCAG